MEPQVAKLVNQTRTAVSDATNDVMNAKTPEDMVNALKKLVFIAIPLEHGMFLLTGPHPDMDNAAKYVVKSLERLNDGQTNN